MNLYRARCWLRRVSASPFCAYKQSQNTYHIYMQAVHQHRMLYIVCIVNIDMESVSTAPRVGVAVLCINTYIVRPPTIYVYALHEYPYAYSVCYVYGIL